MFIALLALFLNSERVRSRPCFNITGKSSPLARPSWKKCAEFYKDALTAVILLWYKKVVLIAFFLNLTRARWALWAISRINRRKLCDKILSMDVCLCFIQIQTLILCPRGGLMSTTSFAGTQRTSMTMRGTALHTNPNHSTVRRSREVLPEPGLMTVFIVNYLHNLQLSGFISNPL